MGDSIKMQRTLLIKGKKLLSIWLYKQEMGQGRD